ncbi:MAG: adenosine deaminase, partial [bacterium]
MLPTFDTIKKLPKVLLHDHLDGGLRVDTVIELAKKERCQLPSYDPKELLDWFHRGANQGDLRLYLETFKVIYAILQTEEALERVAYESMLDLKADNVVYVETRFAPFFHTERGLTH